MECCTRVAGRCRGHSAARACGAFCAMSRPMIAPPTWLTSATGSPVRKWTSFVRSIDS